MRTFGLFGILVLGPDSRSEFFDPKARVMPRRPEFGEESPDTIGQDAARGQPSAGTAFQGVVTDSVTENIPPRSTRRKAGSIRVRVKRWGKSPPRRARAGRHEKPLPVQGKIGDWAARPIVSGMPHPASLLGVMQDWSVARWT